MPRQLICPLLLLVLGGCASYSADYRERLVRSLPNQREVTFDNTQTYPGKILCGSYTTLTADGFSVRTGRFVVGEKMTLNRPRGDELLIYCSQRPMQALYDNLGIGGPQSDGAALAKVRDDMLAIDAAVDLYYNTANTLPRRLETLLDGNFGVTEEQLVDPWGRAYRYAGGLSGRTAPQYDLLTLGADGEPGGRGTDADISRNELQMLDHALRVGGN